MTFALNQYRLGRTSKRRLYTCHPIIVRTVEAAIIQSPMDFTVVCGYRGEAAQNEAYDSIPRRSTKPFPESMHNHRSTDQDVAEGYADALNLPLSLAVDVAPWIGGRIRWDLPNEIRWLNGFILAIGMPIAIEEGFYIRSGVDWDMDGDQQEHSLIDAPHLEVRRLAA